MAVGIYAADVYAVLSTDTLLLADITQPLPAAKQHTSGMLTLLPAWFVY